MICGSAFSMSGSLNGFNYGAKRPQSTTNTWSGKQPLSALYDLLIGPMEEYLPTVSPNSANRDLVLVLQGTPTLTVLFFFYCWYELTNKMLAAIFQTR